MSKLIVAIAVASILLQSDAFKQAPFSKFGVVNLRKTSLADLSVLHDTGILSDSLDALHHVVGKLANTDFHALHSTFNVADADIAPAAPAASIYSKIDKTGFIGTCADYIEQAIDLSHSLFVSLGIKNSYGFSIILFTFLIKIVTLPLTTSQLESTTKMQKLTPLQKRIQERYVDDEPTKNKMLSQLFQAANVNPLAGCFPALIQIPIFISLYRALQNLIAENKLDEPFLWIPDLEGPVYMKPPGESLDWFKSIFSGTPELGWTDTLAFLSLPVILYASQSFSSKVMAAPKDPAKILTEQEQISQSLVNNLPFVIAFFSLNVPSGLAVYWIINNILTTAVTLVVKKQFKDDVMPPEVAQMMAEVDAPAFTKTRKTSSGQSEMRKMSSAQIMGEDKKEVGFSSSSPIIDTTASEGAVEGSAETVEMSAERVESQLAEEEKKRKKRAASRAKGKKRA